MTKWGNVQPSLDNSEHIGPDTTGDNIHAKKVALYYWNGEEWQRGGAPGTAGNATTERFDYEGSPIIYVGSAPLGSEEDESVWYIEKFDLSDSGAATGKKAVNAVWDDRVSETYA